MLVRSFNWRKIASSFSGVIARDLLTVAVPGECSAGDKQRFGGSPCIGSA